MKTWLLDTGPLVALLDAGDPARDRVRQVLTSFRGIFITTGAVLTEAFYLLRHARGGGKQLVEFIEHASPSVVDIFGLKDIDDTTPDPETPAVPAGLLSLMSTPLMGAGSGRANKKGVTPF